MILILSLARGKRQYKQKYVRSNTSEERISKEKYWLLACSISVESLKRKVILKNSGCVSRSKKRRASGGMIAATDTIKGVHEQKGYQDKLKY